MPAALLDAVIDDGLLAAMLSRRGAAATLAEAALLAYGAVGLTLCGHGLAAKALLVDATTSRLPFTLRTVARLEYVDRACGLGTAWVDSLFRSSILQNAWLRCLGADVA